MNKLTALSVVKAKVGTHSDGNNLYLRVIGKSGKSWICRYSINGRSREMGLGSVKYVSLAEAREAARNAMMLVHKGVDPLEIRRGRAKQVEPGLDPKADETALYRHFDSENRLLYVGISLQAFQRFCQHQSGSPWWLKIARVTIEQLGTRRAAQEAELRAIKTELPIYNKAHKPKVEIIGHNNPRPFVGRRSNVPTNVPRIGMD